MEEEEEDEEGVSWHDNANSPALQYYPGLCLFPQKKQPPNKCSSENVSLKCICRLIKELITDSCFMFHLQFYWM